MKSRTKIIFENIFMQGSKKEINEKFIKIWIENAKKEKERE